MLVKKGNVLFSNLQYSIKSCLNFLGEQAAVEQEMEFIFDHWLVFCAEPTESFLHRERGW